MTSSVKEVREVISSLNSKSTISNKLLPIKLCRSTVLGLVDSGNSFYNAISLAVATKIGLTYYQHYNGPHVGTALAGSTLDIVGIIKNTSFTLVNESRLHYPMSSWLVIVWHLSCDLSISLPFLVENWLDQFNSQGVLLWSKKQVRFPLYQKYEPCPLGWVKLFNPP